MNILSIDKRCVSAVGMMMLLVGNMYAQSEGADRLLQLEKALKHLVDQNAKLSAEVNTLKERLDGSPDARGTVLMPKEGTAPMPVSSTQSETVAQSFSDNDIRVFWKNGLNFQTQDGETWKGKLGGRIQWDMSGYDADSDTEALVGDVNGGSEMRRLRLATDGQIGAGSPIAYKVDIEFSEGTPIPKDAYVALQGIPYVGEFRLGHFKEPFSMEEIASSKHMTFMERGSLNEAMVPSRNNGLQISNEAFDGRLGWAAGVFNEVGNRATNEIEGNNRATGRMFGVPYFDDSDGITRLWHVGIGASAANIQDETINYESRPEGHLAQSFVDTGNLNADHYYLGGVETAFVYGPYSLQAEYVYNQTDLIGGGNADFAGWYLYGSWFLTGESRTYKMGDGIFGRIKPKNNFNLSKGGWGAWELSLRYSNLDLNSQAIMGGEMNVWTAGLSWYPHPNLRAILNYGIANVERLDGAGIERDGITHMAQFRFLADF
jgi:phosphate-selective porin OprO and OprP